MGALKIMCYLVAYCYHFRLPVLESANCRRGWYLVVASRGSLGEARRKTSPVAGIWRWLVSVQPPAPAYLSGSEPLPQKRQDRWHQWLQINTHLISFYHFASHNKLDNGCDIHSQCNSSLCVLLKNHYSWKYLSQMEEGDYDHIQMPQCSTFQK